LTLEELRRIYPQGKVFETQPTDPHLLAIYISPSWFAIPLKDLTASEKELLTTLAKPTETTNNHLNHHSWYRYLFQEEVPISNDKSYRFIHFRLLDDYTWAEKSAWMTGLSEMFPKVADVFFYEDLRGVLVEEQTSVVYDLDELTGILLTLEDDFSCKVQVYLGEFFQLSSFIHTYFLEELHLFKQEESFMLSHSVFRLQDVALHYLTQDKLKESYLFQHLQQKLNQFADLTPIILALWKHKGNISSTAKELFMHRNTLNYRLDKLEEETGLSVKDMDALALLYCLLIQQSSNI